MSQIPLATTSPISPKSPVSPSMNGGASSFSNSFKKAAHEQEIRRILAHLGCNKGMKVADTLQGSIWRATRGTSHIDATSFIFKVTDISLHEASSAIVDGKNYRVQENICLESSILKYLTQQSDCPQSVVKWHAFFKTNTDYWLCMEDGGMSLFDFVQTSHQLILKGKLQICEWQRVVHIIFKQIMECLEFLHRHNVCHNDISLENFLINDVELTVDAANNVIFSGDIQIKLCDFGLAVLHTNNECLSSRHCGKTNYKSPEVTNRKKSFSARANEIWCVGVCLFSLSTGCRPWSKASESEDSFVYIMNGSLVGLLHLWGVQDYVEDELVMLLEAIFQYEDERISIQGIKHHLYMS